MTQRNSYNTNNESNKDNHGKGPNKKTPFVDFSLKILKEQTIVIKIQAANRDMSHKDLVLKSLKLYFDTFPISGLPNL